MLRHFVFFTYEAGFLTSEIIQELRDGFALIEKDNKLNQKILPETNNPEDDVVYSVKF